MPDFHRAQQGADPKDAEGEGRYSLIGNLPSGDKPDTLHAQSM